MNGFLVSLLSGSGPWAIAVIGLVVFAETGLLAGFFLPGDSLLFSAGVLVASGVIHVPLVIVIGAVALAAFAGDQVGYLVGRRFGPRVLSRPNSRLLSPNHIRRAEAFFATYGPRAVILARFVPFARTFTPVIAGVGAMTRRRFVAFNALGAVAWAAVMIVAGALLGGVPLVAGHIEIVAMALVGLSVVPVLLAAFRARRQSRAASATPSAAVEVEPRELVGPQA